MKMSKFKTREPMLSVIITVPEVIEKENNSEIKVSKTSVESSRVFKTAKIVNTFDEELYPVDSEWIMGESPGMKVEYAGIERTYIKDIDLYERIL